MIEHVEVKAAVTVDEAGVITGLAWPFGSPDSVGDTITKGAFRLASDEVPMLYEHDTRQLVGLWTDVQETDAGLQVQGQLFIEDSARARGVRSLVRSGRVGGLSIGFKSLDEVRHSPARRTIKAVALSEVSLVSNPCHPGAWVLSAKSAPADVLAAIAFRRAVERFIQP